MVVGVGIKTRPDSRLPIWRWRGHCWNQNQPCTAGWEIILFTEVADAGKEWWKRPGILFNKCLTSFDTAKRFFGIGFLKPRKEMQCIRRSPILLVTGAGNNTKSQLLLKRSKNNLDLTFFFLFFFMEWINFKNEFISYWSLKTIALWSQARSPDSEPSQRKQLLLV